MIEGCLSQAGSGYSVRPSEGGGPAFTLQVDPQQMQNASLQHDMSKSVGMQVKVYGYPANASADGSPAAAAPKPGSPEENAGIQGHASGASPAAGSQQPATAAGGAMAQGQAAASGPAGPHVLELTEFIPLNKPCGTGTSQAPPKTGAGQSAAE
jgi:hypothetical protein